MPPEVRHLDFDRIRQAASAIELNDVLSVEVRWRADAFDSRANRLSCDHALQLVEWAHDVEGKTLSVWLQFEVTGEAFQVQEDEEKLLGKFGLRATWLVRYGVLKPLEAAGEDMGDFTFANGQLNVFPYLRQQVQDLTTKAGWPPLVLPVFRVPSERPIGCARERGQKSPSERPPPQLRE